MRRNSKNMNRTKKKLYTKMIENLVPYKNVFNNFRRRIYRMEDIQENVFFEVAVET